MWGERFVWMDRRKLFKVLSIFSITPIILTKIDFTEKEKSHKELWDEKLREYKTEMLKWENAIWDITHVTNRPELIFVSREMYNLLKKHHEQNNMYGINYLKINKNKIIQHPILKKGQWVLDG